MDEFMRDFENVAKAGLLNPNEITKEILDEVRAQISFCDVVKTPRWALMDFAMIRLKAILKIDLGENDALLLNQALKNIIKKSDKVFSSDTFSFGCV